MKIKAYALSCLAAYCVTLNVFATDPTVPANPVVAKDSAVIAAPKTEQSQNFIEKININTANAEQLAAALNGVGQKKAEAIVQFREQNGPFKSVEELGQVKGIGEATLAKNKSIIVIE